MIICKLISTNNLIPDQLVESGQTFIIGRNRQCRIKNLNCSRNFCKIQLLNEKKLSVEYLKDGRIVRMKSGEFLNGPGFSYKISLINDSMKSDAMTEDKISWIEIESGNVLIGSKFGGDRCSSDKIAGFDFDFTLVSTKSAKSFPIDENDWKLFDQRLPEYIQQLVNEQGYRFVIFSNQLGISKGKITVDFVKKRFENSLKGMQVPCLIMIATKDDIYRKPCTGLWDHLVQYVQPEIEINMQQCFYVGDAAGRPKTTTKKADFSASDLLFAMNIGVNFLTPEQFINHMTKYKQFEYQQLENNSPTLPEKCFKVGNNENESNFLLTNRLTGEKINDLQSILPTNVHCIIFCGISGSGKTTFFENYLQPLNYVHINYDQLKTNQKCQSLAKKSMSEQRNIVIDNTNIERNSRQQWINLCKQNGYEYLIFYFELSLKHVFHNNKFRQITGIHKSVPDVVIYTQNKKFESINNDECQQQFTINFNPKFTESNHQKLYSLYLIEK
ncbi:polynucleotide kinase 3'-phosphatase [Dermatophagoides pteronyssinus]|uniref:Uncharacterized protein F21D5.5-like n=1 Tax=Dermatophagoides pteronyssinus TaxID=6956 RepID=A0A6P6YHT4_DERPT|nr:uncharacterized protein F21D5.5-like [Dermatophagoides pteronyssinus]